MTARNEFDMQEYMNFQERTYKQLLAKQITSDEYSERVNFYKEYAEIEQNILEIGRYVTEKNIPFTLEWETLNPSTMVEMLHIMGEKIGYPIS